MKQEIPFDISWKALLKIFIFFVFVLILYLSREVFGILFFAVVLSLGIDPIVSFLEKKGMHRLLGTLLVFIFGFLLFFLGIYFMAPILAIEASNFTKDLHDTIYTTFGIGIPESFTDVVTFLKNKVFDLISTSDLSLAGALGDLFTGGVFIIAVIVISFYLSVEKNGTERLLKIILPDEYEPPVLSIFSRFKEKIRRWLAAQLGISLVVGILVGLGLWILGVKYALVLGALAAIFELVPVIGPILIGILAFIVALSDGFLLAVYTIFFFFLVQQLENHVLLPAIVGKAMKVHPVVVIVALLAGGNIGGFPGIVLSVPIAIIAQEVINYIAEMKESKSSSKGLV